MHADKFVELHGDRAGLDDPAIVCGIGNMDGIPFMFIGHQKGRNTKVSIMFRMCEITRVRYPLYACAH
jgi:acetyl-CoA carboxylase alpha subunit